MQDEPKLQSSVSIKLKSLSAADTIERIFHEHTIVRIGRQVKTDMVEETMEEEPQAEPIGPSPSTTPRTTQLIQPLPIYFKSKVVSRIHAEIWLKDGQVYLKDVGSSSGTFLNSMRLSPASQKSRPYPLRPGDVIQLGVDFQGRSEGPLSYSEIYKAVELQVHIEMTDTSLIEKQQQIPIRFQNALHSLLVATNPYSKTGKGESDQDTSVDCCICLCSIGPYQALFIAPCSHCFHYKCIKSVLRETFMFPCPVCRQVANLDASVESLYDFRNGNEVEMSSDSLREDTFSQGHFGLELLGTLNEI